MYCFQTEIETILKILEHAFAFWLRFIFRLRVYHIIFHLNECNRVNFHLNKIINNVIGQWDKHRAVNILKRQELEESLIFVFPPSDALWIFMELWRNLPNPFNENWEKVCLWPCMFDFLQQSIFTNQKSPIFTELLY